MTPWFAIFRFHEILLLLVGAAIVYGFSLKRLTEFAMPYRLRLAEIGEKYLVICNDPTEKTEIAFFLDNALSPWLMISTSVVFIAVVPLALICRYGYVKENPHQDEATYTEIIKIFVLSTFSANPLFGMIVVIEFLIVAITAILVAGNLLVIRRIVRVLLQKEAGRHIHSAA